MKEGTTESRTDTKEVSFKDTLNLPKTDFPIRPNTKIDDPVMVARWEKENVYAQAMECNAEKKAYLLHDGPPYANGNIHLGHAYNKIAKDIITKAFRMSGFHAPVTPGWDCHGLPIELKVTQEKPGMSPQEIKAACRAAASHWIDVQRQEFKQLGVIMDWDHPYITMDHSYEAAILRALAQLVSHGFIERKHKTVAWCASCQTTLATAEIEYEERKDPSIYTLFEMIPTDVARLFGQSVSEPVALLVWTTTPWTLPLNRAVALKPKNRYQLVKLNGKLLVIGTPLVETVAKMLQQHAQVVQEIPSEQFVGIKVRHPLLPDLLVPIVFDDFVSMEEGTACVHVAPGCGPADYELGIRNNLEIYSPITADGKYTDQIKPSELAGMPVVEVGTGAATVGQLGTVGQFWVIKQLAAAGTLFHKASIKHSYPHCWRCHQGLIFRATRQWFFDLQREGVKEKACDAIEQTHFIPETARNSLRAAIGTRLEWCLSRQRSWGVPIPALVCNACDHAYTSAPFIETVAQGVAHEGVEYWDRVPIREVVPHEFSCPACASTDLRKEFDILDVWFESGVSHYIVMQGSGQADIYLEAIDQFRGWFQSSLLTNVALEGISPTKLFMAHGFTVDEQGRKMSKSLGNVVAPSHVIDKIGTDGLRLWVASIGNGSDLIASERLLANVAEVYRKVRNTCRFLLQNLYDFDIRTDAVPFDKLPYVDCIELAHLCAFEKKMQQAYRAGDFTVVFHGLADYCTTELSSLYLDVAKDRLYVEKADGHQRRSAQTVIWYLLDTLIRLMAPIFSFTAEQLSDYYQREKHQSIHCQLFADLQKVAQAMESLLGSHDEGWQAVLQVRSALLKAIEVQREQGVIKHPLEAQVAVFIDPTCAIAAALAPVHKILALKSEASKGETLAQLMQELLVVSRCEVHASSEGLSATIVPGVYATVSYASGTKCPRCWQWQMTKQSDGLCDRCAHIVCAHIVAPRR